jgi:hypothetical protein
MSQTPAELLASLGITTLSQWAALPVELRRKTARAAAKLPYVDSSKSRWEAARVASVRTARRR